MPQNKIPHAQGFVLHDWHAEILAIRGFNHFLIQECLDLITLPELTSPYVRRRRADEISSSQGFQPFTIQENLKIHMYCSEAPCGDASMELTMDAQDDPTPWPIPEVVGGEDGSNGMLRGRGYFSELGVVRRKPCECILVKSARNRHPETDASETARPDSHPTLSKSCSDKLALKQCTSLLSSPASLLISPENAYIHSLILPSSQYVASACQRAFGSEGRMKPVAGREWPGSYAFHPFEVRTTSLEFPYSRRASYQPKMRQKGFNTSMLWTLRIQETLINGVLQGRKQTDPRGATVVCRKSQLGLVAQILRILAIPSFAKILSSTTYSELKAGDILADRRGAKNEVRAEALKGWIPNSGDDFDLEPDLASAVVG